MEIKANHLFNYKVELRLKNSIIIINPKLHFHKIYRDINQIGIKAGFIIHKPKNQCIGFKCLHKEKIYNFLSKKLYISCFLYLTSPLFITVDQKNTTLVKKDKMINRNVQNI